MSYGSADLVYDSLTGGAPVPGEFPMHGIQREIVERLVTECAGLLRHVEIDERCGREWVGYRYVIQKTSTLERLLRRVFLRA